LVRFLANSARCQRNTAETISAQRISDGLSVLCTQSNGLWKTEFELNQRTRDQFSFENIVSLDLTLGVSILFDAMQELLCLDTIAGANRPHDSK
jgi:hypothetical protein